MNSLGALNRASCALQSVSSGSRPVRLRRGARRAQPVLPPAFTRAANDQRVGDRRVGPQYLFDLFDENLFAAGVYHQRVAPE